MLSELGGVGCQMDGTSGGQILSHFFKLHDIFQIPSDFLGYFQILSDSLRLSQVLISFSDSFTPIQILSDPFRSFQILYNTFKFCENVVFKIL